MPTGVQMFLYSLLLTPRISEGWVSRLSALQIQNSRSVKSWIQFLPRPSKHTDSHNFSPFFQKFAHPNIEIAKVSINRFSSSPVFHRIRRTRSHQDSKQTTWTFVSFPRSVSSQTCRLFRHNDG
ncbi:hypothetical protein N656DRAFT_486029 [Canariomyces notabilis]|uniref:Uncharacterized protein n=1 Tax=Canariomyces notabilis TaxID=2074819 RepID=A0AAN6TIM0_9PEZI|nr:hypothetical protein N656DRAFT_486029 [Canariomyces arenarius]